MIRKQFDIVVKEKRPDGGQIRISTGAVDRDKDRVLPSGARIDNYMKNPVVQWGHNYHDPWATIGKTNDLVIDANGITADFTLRPAANEHDPQHVIRLLWDGGWINAASIGFDPSVGESDAGKSWQENELGGYDFTDWDLLEWSLVPIPANQEALRLAVKALSTEDRSEPMIDSTDAPEPDAKDTEPEQPIEPPADAEPIEPDDEPDVEELDAPQEVELPDEVVDALAGALLDIAEHITGGLGAQQ